MALGKGYNRLLDVDPSETKSSQAKKAKTGAAKKSTGVKKTTTKSAKNATSKSNTNVDDAKDKSGVTTLKISEIEPNSSQPRKDFNEDALSELADSIKKFGIIEPIIVSKKGSSYIIIAGERRWRASRLAGLTEVPVVIRDYTDRERMEVALIENLQREDLNVIEEAMAYKSLIDEYNLNQDEVAERVSKSRPAVTNSLRLLNLSENVQQMLIDDMISAGHARALLAIDDPDVQYETALSVFDEKLSVRETEALVKGVNNVLSGKEIDDTGKVVEKKEDPALQAILFRLEEDLKTSLGSKVAIKTNKGKKGKIEIEYISMDDLERIIHIINTGVKES